MHAGFDVLLGVDVWQPSLDTYAANIPGAATLNADITGPSALTVIQAKLGGTAPTVVIAGTPCQGFSRAGPRDPADDRNAVLKAAMRVAVRLDPKVIVFENVANVRTDLFAHHLRSAEGVLRRAGYTFRHAVLNAQAFGVPQSRRRLILVGVKRGCKGTLALLLHRLASRPVVAEATVEQAFRGLDPHAVNVATNHDPMAHGPEVKTKIAGIAPGTGPMSYRKLHPHRPAGTLICGHRAMPCHYAAARTITVREAARIQSFPDDFKFVGVRGHQMQQVANAVPPKLALAIGLLVRDLLHPDAVHPDREFFEAIFQRVSLLPEPRPDADLRPPSTPLRADLLAVPLVRLALPNRQMATPI